MNILLVDDEQNSRAAVSKFLGKLGHDVTECGSGEEALLVFCKGDFPLVLSDIKMPGLTGIELLRKIKTSDSSWKTDVVLFTGYGNMESAIAALRAGAYDYLLKPVSADELAMVAERVAEHQALLRENRRLKDKFSNEVEEATYEVNKEVHRLRAIVFSATGLDQAVFHSRTMQDILALAIKYHHDRSMPILIEGETGTGKEVIARLIHYGDPSNPETTRPFVDINCAALPGTLFESELFGYEAGSFTGGIAKGRKGKLDAADGGTLFLDEVSEIPIELQSKLLRVIQEKEYYRIGGLRKIKADARIVCATNITLSDNLGKSNFRKDLYYRLKVGHIIVPPLRERKDDIIPLANQYLLLYARNKNKLFDNIGNDAAELLLDYSWPGNVRELKNVIEWAVFMYDEKTLRRKHLSILEQGKVVSVSESANQSDSNNCINIPLSRNGLSMDKIKKAVIVKVLAKHNGNKSAAARYLNISRRSLLVQLLREEQDKTKHEQIDSFL